jgi:nitric oxide reductase activation protein
MSDEMPASVQIDALRRREADHLRIAQTIRDQIEAVEDHLADLQRQVKANDTSLKAIQNFLNGVDLGRRDQQETHLEERLKADSEAKAIAALAGVPETAVPIPLTPSPE